MKLPTDDHRLDLAPATTRSHWQATLALGFEHDAGTTRMTERRHCGPLRVQKALYPEHPSVCHAIIVHPPGGVVGGDRLAIKVRLDNGAAALIATPGAGKWYRANGHVSHQTVEIAVAAGAALEWLPQETIFFNDAQVELCTTIDLQHDAQYLGCEILCFGRTAANERFDSGAVRMRTSIQRDGKLIWFEQGAIDATDPMMQSALGMAGKTVCATLLAAGASLSSASIATLREALGADCGVTQMKSLLIVRYLGNSSEAARRVMLTAWKVLRPLMLGRAAVVPRIWNT